MSRNYNLPFSRLVAGVGLTTIALFALAGTTASAADSYEEEGLSVSLEYRSYTDSNGNGVQDSQDDFIYAISTAVSGSTTRAEIFSYTTNSIENRFGVIADGTVAVPGLTGEQLIRASLSPSSDPSAFVLYFLSLGYDITRDGETIVVETSRLSSPPIDVRGAALTATINASLAETHGDITDGLADVGDVVTYNATITNTGDGAFDTISALGKSVTGPAERGASIDFPATATHSVTIEDVFAGAVPSRNVVFTGDSALSGIADVVEDASTPAVPTIDANLGLSVQLDTAFRDAATGEPVTWPEVGDELSVTGAHVTNTSNVAIDGYDLMSSTCASTTTPIAPGGTDLSTCLPSSLMLDQGHLEAGAASIAVTPTRVLVGGTWYIVDVGDQSIPLDDGLPEFTFAAAGVLDDVNGDGLANEGETIDFTLTTTNTGPYSLDDLLLRLTDEGDLSLAEAFTAGTALAPRDTETFTHNYTVTKADENRGSITYTPTMSPSLNSIALTPIAAGSVTIEAADGAYADASGLAEDNRGTVTVPSPLTPGATFSALVGGATPGTVVDVYAFSTAVPLGQHAIGIDGGITLTLPEEITDGDHRIGVYLTTGDVIGWAPFTVESPAADASPAMVTPTTSVKAVVQSAGDAPPEPPALASTGPESAAGMTQLALVLAGIGVVLLAAARHSHAGIPRA
ncbi:DUF7507 domain-containing protein [Demequina oxidasica]|uniref:DUF7507 domain-containing protein n=1 Tax=Demequina oxidasica TaxID=676199 RepID=UPI0007860484